METISNAASTAATTVSNLIYGQPAKDNETQGYEPVSGQQGKGTPTEPFDKGNSEDPLNPSSSTTNATSDDFLKLNTTLGTKATDTATNVKTGTTSEASMPFVSLNPDAAISGSGPTSSSTSTTGVTDKAGTSDTVWKPTAIDEVKPSGAPGAGPEAPANVKPAVPEGYDGSSAPKKESVGENVVSAKESASEKVDSAKDSATTKDTQGSTGAHKDKLSNSHEGEIPFEPTPAAEHSVPDEEANDPESKMQGKTTRHTGAAQPDKTGEAKVVPSSKSPERAGSGSDDKDGKMSHLKDKLKNKLHIGSKDK